MRKGRGRVDDSAISAANLRYNIVYIKRRGKEYKQALSLYAEVGKRCHCQWVIGSVCRSVGQRCMFISRARERVRDHFPFRFSYITSSSPTSTCNGNVDIPSPRRRVLPLLSLPSPAMPPKVKTTARGLLCNVCNYYLSKNVSCSHDVIFYYILSSTRDVNYSVLTAHLVNYLCVPSRSPRRGEVHFHGA